MIPIVLILASAVLWQEDFTDNVSTLSQLYDYNVAISHEDGIVTLTANPQFEGFASAWLYVEGEVGYHTSDALEMRIKVNANTVRVRYFFRKKTCKEYYAGEQMIQTAEDWQTVQIPLRSATPFFGMEFPAALTPDKTPVLYLFIENAAPGDFNVELDRISVERTIHKREQR
jgi:hypothetical protein